MIASFIIGSDDIADTCGTWGAGCPARLQSRESGLSPGLVGIAFSTPKHRQTSPQLKPTGLNYCKIRW
jgi:hypothetical protein